jgi:Tfp pilus assembly protein PilF
MKNLHFLIPVLCATPVLESCTSLPPGNVSYPVKPLLDVRHANESPEAYYQLGRYYQARNRLDDAAKVYQRALLLRPGYEHAANALATVYAAQGQYDLAIAGLRAAIDASPRTAYLYNNLGYAYQLKGDYAQAIAAFESAVGLDPANRRALNNLGQAYAMGGAAAKSREAPARAAALPAPVAQQITSASTPRTHLQNPAGEPSTPVTTLADAGAAVLILDKDRGIIATHTPNRASQHYVAGPATSQAAADMRRGELVRVAPSIYELRPIGQPSQNRSVQLGAMQAQQPPAVPTKAFRLEVSNGNGKTGMAKRVAEKLKEAGMDPTRLTNQIPWQRATEIQFSEGYALEAARLAGLLQHRVLTVRNDGLRKDIKVRLVLGKDIRDELALVAPDNKSSTRSTRVASAK